MTDAAPTSAGPPHVSRREEHFGLLLVFLSALFWSFGGAIGRWSGEGAWVPLGDLWLDIPPENATHEPSRGQILFYPGGISETEILLAYGGVRFASKVGQLAGNHFITLTSNLDKLSELGVMALWPFSSAFYFADAYVFEALRALRTELARARGVPAYVIFGDVTLREMAREYPIELDQLEGISGVGARKLAEYGPIFVATIAQYLGSNSRLEFGR